MDYRNDARGYLKSASEELASAVDGRVAYAALDLRKAMEAITYDRALAYKSEIPPSEYATWQPKKVMTMLIDIDPAADMDSTLAVGIEDEPGVQAEDLTMLGSETVLNMATLRRHYDALGSYLHVPTLKQAMEGKVPNPERLRERCTEIGLFLERVLASPIHNITLGEFATMACMECGEPVRKRIPRQQGAVQAECFGCHASYTITDDGGGKVKWVPHQHEIACANASCKKEIVVWQHELEIGRCWTCPDCLGRNVLVLGVRHDVAQKT
jgi:hypothetical protein